MEWLKTIIDQEWVSQLIVLAASLFVFVYAETLIFKYSNQHLKNKKRIWMQATLLSAHPPFLLSGILLLMTHAGKVLLEHFGRTKLPIYLANAEHVIFVLAFIWFLVRLVGRFEINMYRLEHHRVDKPTLYIYSRLLRMVVAILGLLTILPSIGIPISGLLAFGGGGALAVGFAAKDILSNFCSGLLLFMNGPFKIGDWISSPDREIEGTVEHIGWRLTLVRTLDKRALYVPNSLFSSVILQNISRMTHRRIKTTIGLRYKDASVITVILSKIEQLLRQHPQIDTNETIIVNLIEFGPSSLNFLLYALTKTVNWVEFQSLQQSILMDVFKIVAEEGAEIAFPVTTLNFEKPDELELLKEKL